jgi:hypothetical protein
MQNTLIHPVTQPFFTLVRANMDLLARFSTSPEALSQSLTDAQRLAQQGHGSMANLVQSKGFAELMQGMLRNYTEFMTEVGQNTLAMLSWSQQTTTRQIQDGSEKVIDAADALARRSHKAV